jgi:hypothetical protein
VAQLADNNLQVLTIEALRNVVAQAKPKARVYDHWLINQGYGESVPDLLSATEDEWGAANTPWIHGYFMDFDGFPRTELGSNVYEDEYPINLWGVYGWFAGSNAAKSSSKVFSRHIKDVQNAVSRAFRLNHDTLLGGVEGLKAHHQWTVDRYGTYWFGKYKVHVAQGQIVAVADVQVPIRQLGT